MGRNSEVNYWPSRGGYYSTIRGKQELLAKGLKDEPDGAVYRAALKRFDELVFGPRTGPTFEDIAAKHLGWAEHNASSSTVSIRRGALKLIRSALGESAVDGLTVFDVLNFCDRQRQERDWGEGQVNLVIKTVKVMMNWAVEVGLIPSNPLAKLKPPQAGSRGLECVLEPSQEAAIIAVARPALRDFCQAMRDTGARPGEICKAEARHYDPAMQALVFQAAERVRSRRHKTSRTGRPRIVFLSGESIDIVRRLCEQHPTGPLFRTPRARQKGEHRGQRTAWTQGHLHRASAYLRGKAKVPHFCFYSFRHTFAVCWLRQGQPTAALAEVLGTSEDMIRKHYGHLADQHDYLRRLVDLLHASREQG